MLPIGSIVYLNDGSRKIMILNRGPLVVIDDKTQMFDYSGCIYPVGLVQDQVLYFNQENIDRVIFEGFADEDEERFQEMYFKWIQENAEDIDKGQVRKPLNV